MSKIKKPEELPVKTTVVGGLYGQPGVGKTSLALSFPKPLLLDTDNGLYRVQAEFRCDSVPVESYQDILDVLKEDLSDYETIVVDTLGKLVDFIALAVTKENPNLLQKDGTISIKAWGIIKNYFKAFITDVQALKKNLIFVSHEKESSENDVRIIRPDVSGSAGKDIIKELDFLGYMEMVGKKRSISFSPSSKFYAKNSLGIKDYVEVPTLSNGNKNSFMTDFILKPTIERRKNEFKMVAEYEKVIKQAEAIIAQGINDENLAKLRELPKIGDSHMQIKARIDLAIEGQKNA